MGSELASRRSLTTPVKYVQPLAKA
jgi:hypothetical protein